MSSNKDDTDTDNSNETIDVSHLHVLFNRNRFILNVNKEKSAILTFIQIISSLTTVLLLLILSSSISMFIDIDSRIILFIFIILTWFMFITTIRSLHENHRKKNLMDIWLHNKSVINSMQFQLNDMLSDIHHINIVINKTEDFEPLDEVDHKLTKLLHSIPIFPTMKVILPSQRDHFRQLKMQSREVIKTCKRLIESIELKKKHFDLKLLNDFKIEEWKKCRITIKEMKNYIDTNQIFFERINSIISDFSELRSIKDLRIIRTNIEEKLKSIPVIPKRISIPKKNLSNFDCLCKELKEIESLLEDLIVKIDNAITFIEIESKVENIEKKI